MHIVSLHSYHRLFVVDCPREIFSDVIDIESLPTCDYMDFDDNSFSTTDATSLSLEHQTASNELQNNLTANKQLNSADHCGTASLDLSQVNGSCIAQLLPKMFTSEVVEYASGIHCKCSCMINVSVGVC